ncbi:MAG: aldo/keto reductase [Flavisolibacter sp.]
MRHRKIPSTGETIAALGLGTWQTFDAATSEKQKPLAQVLAVMQEYGGKLIDTSPMYGNAEKVIGALSTDTKWNDYFFYATKVWTTGKQHGMEQMKSSFLSMKRTIMDLIQIHNLTDWKTHLQTLIEWKKEGKVRYIGVTHYTDSMHGALEQILLKEKIDVVQFNYSIFSRNAEKKLLPLAEEKGVACLINRPFGEGKFFNNVKDKLLPPWAQEFGITSWSQYFLAYILSHPAVTCIIPATGNPEHARENYSLNLPSVLEEATRKKMIAYAENL